MLTVRLSPRAILLGSAAVLVTMASEHTAVAANITDFTPGDRVISTVSGATLDTAAPIVLDEFQLGNNGTSAASVGTLTLPQTSNGANAPISGEYGSASMALLATGLAGVGLLRRRAATR